MNLVPVFALSALALLGCEGDIIYNEVGTPPIIEELPNASVTLSADVDVYVITTAHNEPRTYTLPHVSAYETISVDKLVEYCNQSDAIYFVDDAGKLLAEITNEGSDYHCRGWMKFATIGDAFAWHLAEFGGDVNW